MYSFLFLRLLRPPRFQYVAAVLLLGAAGACRFVLAPHYTQRVPPGWEWRATFLGSSSTPDEKTGQFPDKDTLNTYEREMTLADESGRPTVVVLEYRYTGYEHGTRKITWEYITRELVDPWTGARLEPEFQGDVALFPRNTQKQTYSLRTNYLKGVPLRFEREERIEGLNTYVFSYKGRGEYTESYAGSPKYPGIRVEPGQEIKCADDQFSIRAWVEPVTGEIIKVDERAPSGDWIYDVATGKKLAPVLRWRGSTAGDDLLRRVDAVRWERTRLLSWHYYSPWLLVGGALILSVSPFLRRRATAAQNEGR